MANATSALGLALGSINGAVNLDVALSALERSGQGRLLSTPRVSTQNNVEAEITQGVQIPIQTVANNTVTVTFKDAALTLKVTPQITASNTVIMRVNLENAAPDYSRAINDIPPIDTQRAVTTVLVADGETTVIGGIYLSREQSVQGRTPLLSRVPLLGWLFKRDEIERRKPRAAHLHHAAHHQGLIDRGDIYEAEDIMRVSTANHRIAALLLAASALLTTACGEVARTGRSPGYLQIARLEGASGAEPDEFGDTLLFSDVADPRRGKDGDENLLLADDLRRPGPRRVPPRPEGPGTVGGTDHAVARSTPSRSRVTASSSGARDGRNTQGVDVPYALRRRP